MSSFGITARFPLGTYQGHRDGRSEALPDITRLFDALTHAAGTGSLAEERDGDLRPSAASRVALEWLEAHPPSALHLPWTQMSTAPVTAYRAEGVFDGRKGQASDRKTQRAVGASALAGPIGWMWDDDPPPAVKDTLASLIGDVAYLGEAESPVVLEIGTLRSTHRCEPEASPLVPLDGRVVRAPVTGRFAALEVAYEARYPSKRPGVGHDAFSWSQLPTSARVPVERSEELAYARVRMSPPPAPWSEVFLIPVVTRDGESPEFAGRDRVRWSVATHRALVAQPALAYTASPVVTGRYPARVRERHVNRVAIHPLGVEVMRSASPDDPRACLAVLIPPNVTADEKQMIAAALSSLRRVYAGTLGELRLLPGRVVDATAFWPAPPPGTSRLWRTSPAVVPETRPQRDRHGRGWSLADSAALSLGFVHRDLLGVEPRKGREGYTALRDAVLERGVRVLDATPVRVDVDRYVHKLPRGVVAQPYRATLSTGSLVAEAALSAIGQSRHLGGGLLRPFDVPTDVVDEWMGGHSWSL